MIRAALPFWGQRDLFAVLRALPAWSPGTNVPPGAGADDAGCEPGARQGAPQGGLMPRSAKPVNRVDEALRIARDALDVANECSLREQTHRFVIQTIIGVL